MFAKFLRGLVLVGASTVALNAHAADLGGYRGAACVSHTQSTLPQQSHDVISQTLWANFQSAESGMSDPRVQASPQPAFTWAMQARWACSAAIGYLEGGHVNEEAVQKCDCFHQRFASFR